MARRPGAWPFLLPALVVLGAVQLYPTLVVLWLSLERRIPVFGIAEFVGLANYRFLLEDPRFWQALWTTAYFTVVSVGLELLWGGGIALLLHRRRRRGLLLAGFLLPWALPGVVSAKTFTWLLYPDGGLVNYLLGAAGGPAGINWLGDPAWAIHAVILADAWRTTPFVLLLVLAGLELIPREVHEAAAVDGAGKWRGFIHVTLPLLGPVLGITLLIRTIDALRVFDVIYVLTGGGPAATTETLTVYAYRTFFGTLQFGYGATLAVTTLLAALVLAGGYLALIAPTTRPAAEGA